MQLAGGVGTRAAAGVVVATAALAPSARAWYPRWVIGGPVTVTVRSVPAPPQVVQRLPLPVRASAHVLPPLQQVLPPLFQERPLQVARLPGGQMALSHPLLFCSLDQAAMCAELARPLAEVTRAGAPAR
jgi:hypothetical protein